MGSDRSKEQKESHDRAAKIYQQAQILEIPEAAVNPDELRPLSENWKEQSIPDLQRKVVDAELESLRQGIVNPVYGSLIETLKRIPLIEFSLLDAACASGYYSEVIRTLDKRKIQYAGSDYSAAMVEAAKGHYPDRQFQVQDLTALTYADKSVDVVLVSGVLEHIPNYDKAIREACRVAGRYLIFHRFPFTGQAENEYTVGSQYSIKTPRIYFSRKAFLAAVKKNHFVLVYEQDTYPSQLGLRAKWKSRMKILIGLEAPGRQIKTMLFQRHGN